MPREIGALTTLGSNVMLDRPAQRILLPPTRASPHNINAAALSRGCADGESMDRVFGSDSYSLEVALGWTRASDRWTMMAPSAPEGAIT
jgi:hypothetical protein